MYTATSVTLDSGYLYVGDLGNGRIIRLTLP